MTGKFQIREADSSVEVPWGLLRFISNPQVTGSMQLVVIDGAIHPGAGHDFHHHPNRDEVIYVTAGRIEQWIGREMRILSPGDAAFIPAGTVHASFASDGPASLLAIIGPSVGEGGLEMVDVAGEQPWQGLRGDR